MNYAPYAIQYMEDPMIYIRGYGIQWIWELFNAQFDQFSKQTKLFSCCPRGKEIAHFVHT